jgi:hypothetical protein
MTNFFLAVRLLLPETVYLTFCQCGLSNESLSLLADRIELELQRHVIETLPGVCGFVPEHVRHVMDVLASIQIATELPQHLKLRRTLELMRCQLASLFSHSGLSTATFPLIEALLHQAEYAN